MKAQLSPALASGHAGGLLGGVAGHVHLLARLQPLQQLVEGIWLIKVAASHLTCRALAIYQLKNFLSHDSAPDRHNACPGLLQGRTFEFCAIEMIHGPLIQRLHAITGCSPLPLRPSCAPMGICGGTDSVELSGGGESLCIPSTSRLCERLPLVTTPVEYRHV